MAELQPWMLHEPKSLPEVVDNCSLFLTQTCLQPDVGSISQQTSRPEPRSPTGQLVDIITWQVTDYSALLWLQQPTVNNVLYSSWYQATMPHLYNDELHLTSRIYILMASSSLGFLPRFVLY